MSYSCPLACEDFLRDDDIGFSSRCSDFLVWATSLSIALYRRGTLEYGDLVGDFRPFWFPIGSLGSFSILDDICNLFGDILVLSVLSMLALFFGDLEGILPVGMSESLEL